jgi:hypothetical protein
MVLLEVAHFMDQGGEHLGDGALGEVRGVERDLVGDLGHLAGLSFPTARRSVRRCRSCAAT